MLRQPRQLIGWRASELLVLSEPGDEVLLHSFSHRCSDRLEITMHRMNCSGSFAYRSSNPSVGSGPDIARRKYAGNIRLEHERLTLERPASRFPMLLRQIRTRLHESGFVTLENFRKGIGVRLHPDEDEHRSRGNCLRLP